MLRQLISKWGIMSIDLQTAVDKDMAVIHEDGSAEYVENEREEENVVADQELNEVPEEPQKVEPVQAADTATLVKEADGQRSISVMWHLIAQFRTAIMKQSAIRLLLLSEHLVCRRDGLLLRRICWQKIGCFQSRGIA